MSCSGAGRGRGKSWAGLKQKSLREGIINQQPIVWKRERTQKGRIWQMKPRHADLQAKREDFVPRAVPEQAWLALFIRQHQMLQHFLSVHPRHPVYLKNPNNISVKQTFWERERRLNMPFPRTAFRSWKECKQGRVMVDPLYPETYGKPEVLTRPHVKLKEKLNIIWFPTNHTVELECMSSHNSCLSSFV